MIFQEKTILITGAAGTVGNAITKFIVNKNPKKIILLDHAETPLYDLKLSLRDNIVSVQFILGSINDKKLLKKIFSAQKIDIIYHAAAYKHVPFLEEQIVTCVVTNLLATKRLVHFAEKSKVSDFIFISTDKAVNPSCIMGTTKHIAENYIQGFSKQSDKTRFIITRFGNIEESNGSVIPLFKKQIKTGQKITVTHKDTTRYFISIASVISFLQKVLNIGDNGDVLIYDMGQPQKILTIAQKMIKEANCKNSNINFIGLRPGEKINEVLIEENSQLQKTDDPKIFLVKKTQSVPFKVIKTQIKKLKKHCNSYNKEKLLEELKKSCQPNCLK